MSSALRSSHHDVIFRKDVLENFTKFRRKHMRLEKTFKKKNPLLNIAIDINESFRVILVVPCNKASQKIYDFSRISPYFNKISTSNSNPGIN